MHHPIISIIIPVYNGAKYLKEAIQSSLNQSYQNIEIIIINDGSNDAGTTDELAQIYANKFPDKIRYFKKENGGCASALNLGIEKMRGEYFSWLSHDDIYLTNKLEHQIKLLEELDDKNTIIYSGYDLIDENSNYISSVKPHDVLGKNELNKPLMPLLRGLIHGCSLLIPKIYFEKIGVFDESLLSTQDYALWFKFLRLAPIHYSREILIKSRVHPEQGTHKIKSHLQECNELWTGFLKELTDEEMIMLEGSVFKFFKNTENFLANTPYKKAREYAKEQQKIIANNTKVTIIIPFYNRIKWTIEAINSAQNQTHKNIEIILINDGSSEDTTQIKNIISSDNRIKLFEQENKGQAKARNFAIQKASGTYIAFLDSDDLFEPDKIEIQLQFMLETGYVISHTSYNLIDEHNKILRLCNSGQMQGIVYPDIISCCRIAVPSVMIAKAILIKHSFPENYLIGEDICLWINLCSQFELGAIDKPLCLVRVNEQTSSLSFDKTILGILNIANFCIKDKNHSKYKHHIAKLLAAAVGQLATPENYIDVDLIQKLQGPKTPPPNFLQRLVLLFKKEGFFGGFNKIKLKLKTQFYS